MANEKNTKKTEDQDNIEKPLFTGDYCRDTAVTEFEKSTEASKAIFNAIKDKLSKQQRELTISSALFAVFLSTVKLAFHSVKNGV